ncbi:MAG: hypothetical protein LUQ50_05630 [Methanospirillum sp.]|uniref:hypothetical protein n=1 Tax=Methanospirillum sp. TaxID=45200 RepID=UPI0023755A94|nr:hypothetical protein [Methanospirillum sp.]MDD1728532.1 hypothetical protein [Methanospirillum sp.]
MVRVLTEQDIKLLSIMAPEFSGEVCRGSGIAFKSLLPPVANHYSHNADDFFERISRLSTTDFSYLIDLMQSGEESLHCLPPDYFAILEERIKAVAGPDTARKIGARYAMECE